MVQIDRADGDLVPVLWLLFCVVLVLFMQVGFACLESGQVRTKNSISVATKKIADFCVSTVCFWGWGFAFLFGSSEVGLFGGDLSHGGEHPERLAFFLFHLVFCSTAATLIGGAVAERMRFYGYIVVAALTSGLIYPVFGNWVWAGLDGGSPGWLAVLGFQDAAGATVVHSVGGWIALAACLIMGPRVGSFSRDGGHIRGSNLPLSAIGTFLLMIGWLGFNAGSLGSQLELVPLVFTNTLLAAAGGGLATIVLAILRKRGPCAVGSMNGMLTGLVSVTACCPSITPAQAFLIGEVGGVLYVVTSRTLRRLRVDDAVDAVAVHLTGGIWGTLAVAFTAGSLAQAWSILQVQALGAAICCLACFGGAFVLLSLIDRVYPLRISARNEWIGLNVAEHGAKTELFDLVQSMEEQLENPQAPHPVRVDPHTDLGVVGLQYNRVLSSFHRELRRRQEAESRLRDLAERDGLTGVFNRRYLDNALEREWRRTLRRDDPLSVVLIDLDHFKAFNDEHGHAEGDELLIRVAGALTDTVQRAGDFVARYGGEEFAVVLPGTDVESAREVAERIRRAVAAETARAAPGRAVTLSAGVAMRTDDIETPDELLRAADRALYRAKEKGRNRVCVDPAWLPRSRASRSRRAGNEDPPRDRANMRA